MKTKLKLALVMLLLLNVCPCWALSKGALNKEELNYFEKTFPQILINAHVCTQALGDCRGKPGEPGYVYCGSEETIACDVYGISDEELIKELFMSMLSSGLRFSHIAFHRSKYHEGSIFEKPLLEFTDRTIK